MRRANRPPVTPALTALLLTFLLSLLPAQAQAAQDADTIRSLDVELVLDPSGDVLVTETYAWDFGSREGRGMSRDLTTLTEVEGQPGTFREYRYTEIEASNPSGAPSDLTVVEVDSALSVQVAAPEDSGERVSGVQTYVITYRITGALNAVEATGTEPATEQLYWNLTGDDHAPIDTMTVTARGPVDALITRCMQGGNACDDLTPSGAVITASGTSIDAEENLTLALGFPAGTFVSTEPILVEVDGAEGSGGFDTKTLLLGGGVAVLLGGGTVAAVLSTRRSRRDLAFVGVPPGTVPSDAATHAVEQVTADPVPALRFTPPDGLTVGEAGALWTKDLRSSYVTATLVDLAVRGHLQIVEVPRAKKPDWTLVPLGPSSPEAVEALRDHERLLLDVLFSGMSAPVLLSSLKNRARTPETDVLAAIGRSVKDRGLVNQTLAPRGAGVRMFKQRTALGRALYEQTRGFELYLEGGEAATTTSEDSQAVFSRYLPWAIALGLDEHWAKAFADLQPQDSHLSDPSWYGSSTMMFSYLLFGSAMHNFNQSAAQNIASVASSDTSAGGGSGFSGSDSSFSSGGGGGGGSHGL